MALFILQHLYYCCYVKTWHVFNFINLWDIIRCLRWFFYTVGVLCVNLALWILYSISNRNASTLRELCARFALWTPIIEQLTQLLLVVRSSNLSQQNFLTNLTDVVSYKYLSNIEVVKKRWLKYQDCPKEMAFPETRVVGAI